MGRREITEEEALRIRADKQAATRAAIAGGDSSVSRNELGVDDEHETTCPRPDCGRSWRYPVVVLQDGDGERTVPKREAFRVCPECIAKDDERRRLAEQQADAAAAERRREAREAAILELIHGAGASPWEHGQASLRDAGDEKAAYAARDFAAAVRSAGRFEPVRGLYLFGDTGTGKTHLAVAVLRELLLDPGLEPGDVVFDRADALLIEVQDSYSARRSVEEVLHRRRHAKVWILDDLGTEQPTDDAARKLSVIFSERALRPTLVTSNLHPEDLVERNRELFRIASRLGPRYFRIVKLGGRDRRFDDGSRLTEAEETAMALAP